jgi:hypothetical protein
MLDLSGLYCRSYTNIRLTICSFKNVILLNIHFAEHMMDRYKIKNFYGHSFFYLLNMLLSAIQNSGFVTSGKEILLC